MSSRRANALCLKVQCYPLSLLPLYTNEVLDVSSQSVNWIILFADDTIAILRGKYITGEWNCRHHHVANRRIIIVKSMSWCSFGKMLARPLHVDEVLSRRCHVRRYSARCVGGIYMIATIYNFHSSHYSDRRWCATFRAVIVFEWYTKWSCVCLSSEFVYTTA